jgi:hypothetical protein
VLGEAGLAARDARPRPRQPEARRRHPAGGHPGSGQGSRRHGPHPERDRAVPRQDAAAHAAGMALAQAAFGAHDPRWPAHCRITACQAVRMDNPSCRIVVLRRKGRTFADVGGVCRAVIRCAAAGGAGRMQPAASGPAAGAQAGFLAVLRLIIGLARQGHNPQVDDPRGTTDRRRRPGQCAELVDRVRTACRSRPVSSCCVDVRRLRSGSRRNPHRIRATGGVVGRRRVAPAVPGRDRHRAGAGVRPGHRRLETVAHDAAGGEVGAPGQGPGALNPALPSVATLGREPALKAGPSGRQRQRQRFIRAARPATRRADNVRLH